MDIPILFIIFNRPDTTQKVFDVIRQIRPSRLFIAADGPRDNIAKEKEFCIEARKIVTQVDWKCDVQTLFREKNLGCGEAVSSAITWFFENVEEGIILEDDCLPSLSFFDFCQKMLERYRDEKKIMMISGSNPATSFPNLESDYYYSKVYSIWGWATWRRAWKLYDKKILNWPINKKGGLLSNFYPNNRVKNYFSIAFDNVYNDRIDTWDYQWAYTCITNNGLNIIPKYNMVSNIGVEGTHTRKKVSKSLFLKTFNVNTDKLTSPNAIISNRLYDSLLFKASGIDKLSIRLIVIKILTKIGLYNVAKKISKILK